MDIEHYADKYGWPTVCLITLALFMAALARWLRDKVATPLVDSHNELIKNIMENNSQNAGNIKSMDSAMTILTANQKEVAKKLDENQQKTAQTLEVTNQQLILAIEKQTKNLLEKK